MRGTADISQDTCKVQFDLGSPNMVLLVLAWINTVNAIW